MPFKFLVFFCLVSSITNGVECARILGVFPMPGTSHYFLCSKLMKGLVAAGHDVTMVSPYKMEGVSKNGNYTDVILEGFSEQFQKMMNEFNPFQSESSMSLFVLTDIFLSYTNNTLHHPNVKKLLQSNQQFDAVILEQFSNDALKVFSYLYDCPLIILSSMGPNPWVNSMVGNPQPPSYVAHMLMGDFSRDLSFFNRMKNLYFYILEYLVNTFYIFPLHDNIMHKAFPTSPPIYDLYTNVSLILLNSHTSIYPALPVVPNMVEIGGYFIDPPKKLPEDLQHFLDGAKEGVVYFSMGSVLKSKNIPKERRQIILNVLGRLKEKVLWKFEEDLPEKPSNVMIRKWLPQQDILAHPNVKLFITHGGLCSATETVYHGVPILSIPVFGDQNANADRAVSSGYGLKLQYNDPDFTEERFETLIRELLHNKKYRDNAQFKSKLYHDRPMEPMKTAVYWVEYVIRHRGAPHLRVAGVRLPWYKYYLVDVIGFILLSVAVVLGLLKMGLQRLCRSGGSKPSKKQKTN